MNEKEVEKLLKDIVIQLKTLGDLAIVMTARIDVLSKRLEIVEEQLDQKEQFFTGGGG